MNPKRHGGRKPRPSVKNDKTSIRLYYATTALDRVLVASNVFDHAADRDDVLAWARREKERFVDGNQSLATNGRWEFVVEAV